MEQQQFAQGGNEGFTSGAWAEGTNANTIQNTATVVFSINGILFSKAATNNIAVGPLAAQADLTTCLYGIDLDSAGAVTAVKGQEVLTADVTNGVRLAPLPPFPSRDKCRVALLKIVNTSGAAFILGSVDLGAAGITDTFYNVSKQPSDLKLGGL